MSGVCLFCKIVAGQLPAHKVYEDDHVLAFLDLHPIRAGHTLVIPKAHHVWFEDMPPETASRVMTCAQQTAKALKQTYDVERVALFYTGIHVPHVHAHVVPMHHPHDVSSLAYMADGPESYTVPPRLPEAEMVSVARELTNLLAVSPAR